jgi:hypothetical protein
MLPDPVSYIENMLLKYFKRVYMIKDINPNERGQSGRPIFLCEGIA